MRVFLLWSSHNCHSSHQAGSTAYLPVNLHEENPWSRDPSEAMAVLLGSWLW